MTRILVMGYSAWDVIFPLANTPDPDSKTEVAPIITCGGGPGASAAVALSRLGCEVSLLTMLSDDVEGRAHAAELESEGVDLSLAKIAPDSATPRAIIRVDPKNGERRIYWSRSALPRFDPEDMDKTWLDGFELLHCDTHEAPAARVLAEEARRRDLPVTLDAGSVRAGVRDLVPLCTDVIGAEGFAMAYTGESGQEAALQALRVHGPARVGTTFGSEGVVGLDKEGCQVVPAFSIDAVDTTGAGDAFHAGYAYARAVDSAFRDCLLYGAAVAGLKCRAYGGRAGLPDRDEVTALLAGGQFRGQGPPRSWYRNG